MEMAPAVSRHGMTLSCLLACLIPLPPSLLSVSDLLRNPHHPHLHNFFFFFARVAEQFSASSQLLPRKNKLRVQHRAQGVHKPNPGSTSSTHGTHTHTQNIVDYSFEGLELC